MVQIATMHPCGKTLRQIGKEIGVCSSTVLHHLKHTIRPLWREQIAIRAEEELARVAQLERVAWTKFEKSTQPERRDKIRKELLKEGVERQIVERAVVRRTGEMYWLDLVKWAIEYRAKIAGLYASERRHVAQHGEIRVAGQTPAQFDAETVRLLLQKSEERRRHQQALNTRWR